MYLTGNAAIPAVVGVISDYPVFREAAGEKHQQRRKLHRVMKLTAIILLTACLQVSARGYSQKITLSEKNVSLEKVFSEIKKQTDYRFFYDDNLLNNEKRIDINVKDATLEQVLQICFKDQSFIYEIIDNIIIVKPKLSSSVSALRSPGSISPFIDIKGRVVNENSDPLAGITVTVKGTKQATSTNNNGEFTISNADKNAVLVFSGISVETFEVNVAGQAELIVRLTTKINKLDEVQVIAYGTTTQRLNTGNVITVKAADIEKQPVSNPLLALQGRVPGLVITQSTGFAGSGVTVRIQGQNTISGIIGNDPLYVIDGVPYPSRLLFTLVGVQGSSGQNVTDQANFPVGAGNPFSFINPADIESIDVLKDADATAIYGSRAANGAILITTKKGKVGQTKVDINMQSGWGKVTRTLELMNTSQYLQMRKEALKNEGITILPSDGNYDINGTWDTTRYTDWQKELIGGKAHYTDVQASVYGGTTNTQFLIGTGYHRETTVFPGDLSDNKGSLHFNINNISTNQRFRIQLSGTYLTDNNNLINRDLTQDAIKLPPNAPAIYNPDGTLNWAPLANGNSTWSNPLAFLTNEYANKTNNLTANAVVDYKVLPGLIIKGSFGYTNLQSNETLIFPLVSTAPELRPSTLRRSQFSSGNINTWIVEPQVNYKRVIAKGKLEALLGTTIQQNNSSRQSQTGTGYNSDLVLKDISSAPTKSALSGASTYKYNALFGRINYNWLDKYILNLSARRDGSSRFGSKNQFHNFGSVGAAWIFSNEGFIKNSLHFLSFGKLRAGYGTTGNDQIGDYRYLDLYNPITTGVGVSYQGATGIAPNRLPNPYLAWEETRKLQFGVDLGFFKDRVVFATTYYRNRSSNQLLSYSLPIMTGFPGITENFPALVQNQGWEFTLNTNNITRKDFSWTSYINLTIPQNKLLEFPNLASSSYASILVIGQPITIFKALNFVGVDPTTGLYQFLDKNGNATSNPQFGTDQTVLINTLPKLYGGFQNSVRYKRLQLDFLFQFVKQIGSNYFIGNFIPGGFVGASNTGNQPISLLHRWQNPGDISSIQKFATYSNFNAIFPWSYANVSNAAYSDASYIRLKNLSLSWQLPDKWSQKMHLQNTRIYIQGQNLLTITNYIGLDPENQRLNSLPPLRVLTFGLQVAL